MMELNHLGSGFGTSIFLALQKLYLVNRMNISAVINNTMNHITSKQIASEIVGLSPYAGKKQILFRAIMAFAHCRCVGVGWPLYIAAVGASRSQSHKG